ncbi:bifunctional diaminohydroxyphosphoribosylaminopyrimidine deaminase/5-amino-6-(5-phosphoribosylamino)uracil reductase RibD [Ascidiimonas sp. W6]|uniref:bifunctional diaminohydroxyphosphoribosylaminopyrimidine deaminase/5-amino-6-(5-phosphoribosylamino)uracil reductase RibD n=1 Tax=Ascidiimonas meishanensis TaxID=3128903 RepID=UPI0030EB4F4F
MNIHEKYIKRCIQLAKNGLGTTYSNPLVGSVIVHNNLIIGEGWHYKAGQPHAEVIAINSVKNKELLKNATLYVSLEPCSHYGKTPPCSDLIIKEQIKNIVVGTIDPFAKVAGRGIKNLLDAGCNVTVGVMEEKCRALNKRFFTFHTEKRPYLILKWAESADGFLSPATTKTTKQIAQPIWISNKFSRQLVHKWRSEEQAILVGTNTASIDNPSLTTRNWYGKSPVRVLLDRNLRLSTHLKLLDNTVPTLVFTEVEKTPSPQQKISYHSVHFDDTLITSIVSKLYDMGIQSLIIEGGYKTLKGFIDKGLWDEARVFKGNKVFRAGTPAPVITGDLISLDKIITDELYIWTKKT